MNCEEFSCERPHRSKVNSKGRWYCSELCAQQAARVQGVGTQSGKTASSTTQGLGEGFLESSPEEKTKLSAPQKTLSEKPEKLEQDTTATLNDTERLPETSGTSKWPQTRNASENATERSVDAKTLPESSGRQLLSFDGEKSDSMNLIDDSILHLHGLMKSVERNVRERAKINERIGHVDPQAINSAVNCAKQMGELLKLKILYHKEFK